MNEEKKTINLSEEKWIDLCNKIDTEGLGYFVMDYASPESFSDMVGHDEKAVELFKVAQIAMKKLRDYLRLDDF